MFSATDETLLDVPVLERPLEGAALWEEVVRAVRDEYLSETQDYPWIIGFSGGKDSTVVSQAVFEALLQVSPSQRKRHVHVVSNDTQVESPLVMAHLAKVQGASRDSGDDADLAAACGCGDHETRARQDVLDTADR